MRHLSHPGELPGLPRRLTRQRAGGSGERAGAGQGCRDHPTPAAVPRARLLRGARPTRRCPAAELRRLSRTDGMFELPPPRSGRRVARLPPRRLPQHPSERRLLTGEFLRRLPQPGPVLRQLPCECRTALEQRTAGARLSRREAAVPAESRPSREAGARELRDVSLRPGLLGLPLGSGGAAVQSARARVRSADPSPEEPFHVLHLPRRCDSRAIVTDGRSNGRCGPDRFRVFSLSCAPRRAQRRPRAARPPSVRPAPPRPEPGRTG